MKKRTRYQKIEQWIYDNWLECAIGCVIGEILACITLYPF